MAHPLVSGPVERVLSSLKKLRRSGKGWVALCPAHDDTAASLSISEGGDGRVLLNCHAGCGTAAIVAALGLTMNDLFPAKPRPSVAAPEPQRKQRLVKTYDYTDANGNLLFQTCRFEPKTFRQRRPDGNGGWIWSLGETAPVLYRLPDLIEAAANKKTVFVVEGEKDADALWEFGLPATTSPLGAGKWREAYSESLKGAEVVILPDNDDVGKGHAEQVAASLVNQGCIVRVINLPGLPAKGDFSDWMADETNDIDRLWELIGTTPRWTGDAMMAKRRVRWRLDELWENDAIMRPPPPVVPRMAWSGRSTLLAAREKIGKSTLVGYIAAQVSRGGTFLGEPCPAGDVLIVCLEEYPGDTARRLKQFNADATRIHLLIGFSGDPHSRPQELAEHVEAVDPLLVIVDTLAAYSHGLADDDNSATQMTAVLQPISKIAHEKHVALILVHHSRKTDGRARGSTAITAGTDVVCEIDAPDEDAEPTLRRVRTVGRVPVQREYQIRYDGDTYTLDKGDAPLDQRIVEFIRHHPGTTLSNLREMVKGRYDDISKNIGTLIAAGMVLTDGEGRSRKLYVRN